MSESPSPTQGVNPIPFLAGLAVALVGYFAVLNITNALGFGGDVHALRVGALALPLFVGGATAFRPSCKQKAAVGLLLGGVALGVLGWAFAPCRFGGPSLARAAAERAELRDRLATPPMFDEIGRAREIGAGQGFAVDYPSLAETVRPALDDWGKAAIAIVEDRFERAAPDDVGAVNGVVAKADMLEQHLPQTREAVAAAERAFSDRSADFWAAQLNRIPPGDYAAFLAWGVRRDAVKAVQPNWSRLAPAMEAWATRSADSAIDSAYYLRRFKPERSREILLRAARNLREMTPKDAGQDSPFRTPHRKLFDNAFAAAQSEAREHVAAGAYDRAFGVAKDFAVDWSPEAELIGHEAVRPLEGFREGYRYLDALAAKAGDAPGVAPAPRTRP